MERRKWTATKVRSAKTNRPDFFRGKQPVFPSGDLLKQEAYANTLFRKNLRSAAGFFQWSRTKERGLWFAPNYLLEGYAVQLRRCPTKRDLLFRPDANYCSARRDFFLLYSRLSPLAKDLCGKLSTNDNITHPPAYGVNETERRKRTATKVGSAKTIGRTSSGESPVSP